MGGFLGIGGSSAKTDRNQTLSSYQNLNSLFNFGFGTGQSLTSSGSPLVSGGVAKQNAGSANLDTASGYFSNLARGNRPAMLAAAAPVTNAIASSGDATRKQQADMGTARGGGVAGANQTADTDRMTQINNALFAVQPEAAKEVADIGTKQAGVGTAEAGIGLGEIGAGLNAENLALGAAGTNLDASIKSRTDSYTINRQAQQDVTGVIQSAMKTLFA